MKIINCLFNTLIMLPQNIANNFLWAGPLLARVVVGYTFMTTGWAKLNNLETITGYFAEWGIPFPHILTPLASGWEFFGGLFLLLGFLTRISGGGLAVVMVVAIISAKLADVEGLADLLGFEEATYFAVFTWLAIAGAGKISVDYWLENQLKSKKNKK